MFGGSRNYALVTFVFRQVSLLSILQPPLKANVEYLQFPVVEVDVVDTTYTTAFISITHTTTDIKVEWSTKMK